MFLLTLPFPATTATFYSQVLVPVVTLLTIAVWGLRVAMVTCIVIITSMHCPNNVPTVNLQPTPICNRPRPLIGYLVGISNWGKKTTAPKQNDVKL